MLIIPHFLDDKKSSSPVYQEMQISTTQPPRNMANTIAPEGNMQGYIIVLLIYCGGQLSGDGMKRSEER